MNPTENKNSPEIVTDIVQATSTRNDLRSIQTSLYNLQQKARVSTKRQASKKRIALLRYRARVKNPAVADCKVVDTRMDCNGRLFFELSNGQAVRADKAAHREGKRTITLPCSTKLASTYAIDPKITNPLLRVLISEEVEKNAARAVVGVTTTAA
jgi:hypothetical protein